MSSSVLMTCGLKVNLLGPVELVSEEGAADLRPQLRVHWGHALVITGDLHVARAAWQQAAEMLDKLRHPDTEAVREPTPDSVLARTTGPGRPAHDCSSRQRQEVD